MEMPNAHDEMKQGAEDPQPQITAGDGGEDDVWQGFEQSVAYMRNLSALYEDAFLTNKKAAVTTAHVDLAKRHASEAIELLASNLLNAASAIVANMESQEEHLLATEAELERVKRRLREQQELHEQEEVRQFFARSASRKFAGKTSFLTSPSQGTLKLALARAAPPQPSAPASPYLYL